MSNLVTASVASFVAFCGESTVLEIPFVQLFLKNVYILKACVVQSYVINHEITDLDL